MEIFDGAGLLNCEEPDIVGCTNPNPGANATPGHPDGKTGAVVLAAMIALHHWGTSKLACPYDQRLLEKAPLFEVGNQRGDAGIRPACARSVVGIEGGVGIPTVLVRHVVELDEADPTFDQTSGHEAFTTEALGAWIGIFETVSAPKSCWFTVEITDVQSGRLHSIGELVACDAGIQFGEAGTGFAMSQIELAKGVEGCPLSVRKGGRRQEVEYRCAAVPQACRLKGGWQKTVGIVGRTAERAGIEERDVTGKVLIDGAKAVRDPGAEAGLACSNIAGMKLVARRGVVVAFGLERVNDAEFVGEGCRFGE